MKYLSRGFKVRQGHTSNIIVCAGLLQLGVVRFNTFSLPFLGAILHRLILRVGGAT